MSPEVYNAEICYLLVTHTPLLGNTGRGRLSSCSRSHASAWSGLEDCLCGVFLCCQDNAPLYR